MFKHHHVSRSQICRRWQICLCTHDSSSTEGGFLICSSMNGLIYIGEIQEKQSKFHISYIHTTILLNLSMSKNICIVASPHQFLGLRDSSTHNDRTTVFFKSKQRWYKIEGNETRKMSGDGEQNFSKWERRNSYNMNEKNIFSKHIDPTHFVLVYEEYYLRRIYLLLRWCKY